MKLYDHSLRAIILRSHECHQYCGIPDHDVSDCYHLEAHDKQIQHSRRPGNEDLRHFRVDNCGQNKKEKSRRRK
jgi:hypothetical protein